MSDPFDDVIRASAHPAYGDSPPAPPAPVDPRHPSPLPGGAQATAPPAVGPSFDDALRGAANDARGHGTTHQERDAARSLGIS